MSFFEGIAFFGLAFFFLGFVLYCIGEKSHYCNVQVQLVELGVGMMLAGVSVMICAAAFIHFA